MRVGVGAGTSEEGDQQDCGYLDTVLGALVCMVQGPRLSCLQGTGQVLYSDGLKRWWWWSLAACNIVVTIFR